ncbi:MAG: hypothetical protein NC131_22115 [Roseburia sp.]|nr:hypothetical protein [Roseburia sp.]
MPDRDGKEESMRTVIVSVINISSILLIIMTHNTVNQESMRKTELSDALTAAMEQTMTEVMEKESYGIDDRNEFVAAFLQAMLLKVDSSISLTVLIHKLDKERGTMEVETVGEYVLPDRRKKQISIRRQIVFAGT